MNHIIRNCRFKYRCTDEVYLSDLNTKERACIAQSHEAHLASAKRRLARLSLTSTFDGPLKGFSGGVKWETNHHSRIKQVALLPVVLLIVVLLLAVTPAMYLAHRWGVFQRRRETVKEIHGLEKERPSMDAPDKKDLEHLWAFHGLHGAGHDFDEKIELLYSWVTTLYGQEAAEAHRIKAQFDAAGEKQLDANRAYYEGRSDTHIHAGACFDLLLSKISKALPAY